MSTMGSGKGINASYLLHWAKGKAWLKPLPTPGLPPDSWSWKQGCSLQSSWGREALGLGMAGPRGWVSMRVGVPSPLNLFTPAVGLGPWPLRPADPVGRLEWLGPPPPSVSVHPASVAVPGAVAHCPGPDHICKVPRGSFLPEFLWPSVLSPSPPGAPLCQSKSSSEILGELGPQLGSLTHTSGFPDPGASERQRR